MSLPNRILDIVMLMKPMLEGSAVKRLLPHLLLVIMLAVVSTLIGTAILIGLFYVLYLVLELYNFTPLCALLTTLGAGLALLLLLVICLRRALCKLKRAAIPAPSGITGIVDSFLDGIRASKKD